MNRKRVIIVVATLAVTITAAVVTLSRHGTGMDTASAMKTSLDADIPVGTAVPEAELRLKARGFTVSDETNSTWGEQKHVDFLYGNIREGAVVERRWQVAVFHKAGVVTGIDVTTALIGP